VHRPQLGRNKDVRSTRPDDDPGSPFGTHKPHLPHKGGDGVPKRVAVASSPLPPSSPESLSRNSAGTPPHRNRSSKRKTSSPVVDPPPAKRRTLPTGNPKHSTNRSHPPTGLGKVAYVNHDKFPLIADPSTSLLTRIPDVIFCTNATSSLSSHTSQNSFTSASQQTPAKKLTYNDRPDVSSITFDRSAPPANHNSPTDTPRGRDMSIPPITLEQRMMGARPGRRTS
jgi:hypothetical protein